MAREERAEALLTSGPLVWTGSTHQMPEGLVAHVIAVRVASLFGALPTSNGRPIRHEEAGLLDEGEVSVVFRVLRRGTAAVRRMLGQLE